MPQPIRIAVLGAGEWAQLNHLPALKAIEKEIPLEIAGIWNRGREKAELAARKFGIKRIYSEFQEARDDASVDCHVVLVNSMALFDIVTGLLPRRLPIFTEKPPGSSYQEACKLAEMVKAHNTVAFNRRYMPISRAFKREAEKMDGPFYAVCQFYRNERPSERFILETGVHGINFMEYLSGPIRSLRTQKHRSSRDGNVFWVCEVTFQSGMSGIMKFLPSSGSSIERYELHGDRESIYLHCPQTYTSDHPGRIFIHRHGKLESTIVDEEGDRLLNAGFLDAYRDFFQAIREGTDTLSNFRNAANSLGVAEAIEAAIGQGEESHIAPSGSAEGIER